MLPHFPKFFLFSNPQTSPGTVWAEANQMCNTVLNHLDIGPKDLPNLMCSISRSPFQSVPLRIFL